MCAAGKTLLCAGLHLNFVKHGAWEYVERRKAGGAVAIVALDDDHQLILTEQWRPPLQKNVIDLPAGIFGDLDGAEQEDPAQAARRELLEETGYAAGRLEFLFDSPTAAGTSDEVIRYFAARQLRRVAPGGGDSAEKITVHAVPQDALSDWLQRQRERGVLIDHKIFAGLYALEGADTG